MSSIDVHFFCMQYKTSYFLVNLSLYPSVDNCLHQLLSFLASRLFSCCLMTGANHVTRKRASASRELLSLLATVFQSFLCSIGGSQRLLDHAIP